MSKIWRTIESSLAYAVFATVLIGVLAWNWREKCLVGTGLLSEFGFGCPSIPTLVFATVALVLTAFVYSMWRGRGATDESDDRADQDEA
jgi:ABC-type Fe3+ transport system permease subunit